MALVAVEATETAIRWTVDGRSVQLAPSILAVADLMTEDSAFVCDPEFFDDLREVRRAFEELLAQAGHTLVPVTRGAREVLATAAGTSPELTGVAGLHALAIAGAGGLGPSVMTRSNLWDVRDALEVAVAVDLFGPSSDSAIETIALVRKALDDEASSGESLRDGDDYRRDVLVAACRVASVAPDRNSFERLLGLSAGAHGALPRIVRSWYEARNTTDTFERESVLAWSDYRRALRRVFAAVKGHRDVQATPAWQSTAHDEAAEPYLREFRAPSAPVCRSGQRHNLLRRPSARN